MKRIFYAALLAVASLLAGIPAAAQHFTCAQYETDAKRWQDIEQLFKRQGWSQWALAVKDAFPLNNDRSIQYRYVLSSDVPCSQKTSYRISTEMDHIGIKALSRGRECKTAKQGEQEENLFHCNI